MQDDPAAPDLVETHRIQALSAARMTARSVAHDLKKRQVFIRRSSIWQSPDADNAAVPTFPHLLRGSGSSGNALKLYLLLLWMAGSPGRSEQRSAHDGHIDRLRGEHTTVLDYERIADLLMISNFEHRASNSGVRLIRSTLRHLRDEQLIELSDDALSIRLLAETRTGGAYSHPGDEDHSTGKGEHRYVKLPPEFFMCGWFTALPAQAIIALLVHRWHWREDRPRSNSFNSEALTRYAPVSKTTMTRGERLLTRWSVLSMTDKRYSGPNPRSRHVYQLDVDRLKRDCPDEVPPSFR